MVDTVAIIVVFAAYLFVFAVGLLLVRIVKLKGDCTRTERELVAGRNLPIVVGVCTMTATIVGGGFLNGTSESVATYGLIWTLAPFGILLGLIFGGLVFAKKMRALKYFTMLDPFYQKYGITMVVPIYLAALCGDLLWSASILMALGTSLGIMTGMDTRLATCLSSAVAIFYTAFGQILAVVYTDVLQLVLIVVGLAVCTPFILLDYRVANISTTRHQWLGTLVVEDVGIWIDLLITMTFGTIPWQSFFQRVLSMQTAVQAQVLSISGAFCAIILVIPAILIGAVGTSANWNQTSLGLSPLEINESYMMLPYVIKEFTPRLPCLLGMAAISAAVMSSVDGAILGSSSMFVNNIYRQIIRKNVSELELSIALRATIIIIGILSTVVATSLSTVYGLFILASDLIFVIIFPQLLCVMMLQSANTYGALAGYLMGLVLRLGGGGDQYLPMPAFIHYPFYSATKGQLFIFRTFSMLMSITTIYCVSLAAHYIFHWKLLSPKWDFLKCFPTDSMYLATSLSSPQLNHRDIALKLTPSTPDCANSDSVVTDLSSKTESTQTLHD